MTGHLPDADYGVIIGRFQVPALHDAHVDLIEGALQRHSNVLVLLGVSAVPDALNPMDYATRAQMIKEKFPNVFIAPVLDTRGDDDLWSSRVDSEIRNHFRHGSALIYGGRLSFIPHYKGTYPCAEVSTVVSASGTDVREKAQRAIPATEEGRAGVIYASANTYPSGLSVVDVACISDTSILLGRKNGEVLWRFPGGFFDPKQDTSLEEAAKRELREEAGTFETSDWKYLGSHRVDDHRYRNSIHKLVTSFFVCKFLWGGLKAGDDLADVRWFSWENALPEGVVPEHKPLVSMLFQHLGK